LTYQRAAPPQLRFPFLTHHSKTTSGNTTTTARRTFSCGSTSSRSSSVRRCWQYVNHVSTAKPRGGEWANHSPLSSDRRCLGWRPHMMLARHGLRYSLREEAAACLTTSRRAFALLELQKFGCHCHGFVWPCSCPRKGVGMAPRIFAFYPDCQAA